MTYSPLKAPKLTRDAMTRLKTLLLLFKVVLVAVATTIGKAGAAFTEGVVIPARDAFLAESCVWQVHTVPWGLEIRQRGNESTGASLPSPSKPLVAAAYHLPC